MPSSLPALVAGILQSDKAWHIRSASTRFEGAPLVPAYQVDPDLPTHEQPARAAQAVSELVQKLARLREAYASWPVFEAGPYFDLYPVHLVDLCRVEETRHIVRVRIYGDLLLPAFRRAERYWIQSFLPAYHAGQAADGASPFHLHLVEEIMPTMANLLTAAETAIQHTLDLLSDNLDVLTSLGGLEERIQHRPRPGFRLAPGIPGFLQRIPREMPTLTLDAILPRPEEAAVGREVWLEQQELHDHSRL